jgi:ABC-type antimicrobial peptide transport system permease subunit
VGIFESDVSLWQANLIFTSFETASRIFNQRELATDFLIYCRPGYQTDVRRTILGKITFTVRTDDDEITTEVISQEDLEAILPKGLLHREGVFNLHFLLAFVLGIMVILVTSGFGLTERRREIGILKAVGWQTDEILLRSLVETFLISLTGASLSLVLSFIWLRWFNAFGVASIFLAGTGAVPSIQVPYKLTPIPTLMAFLISFVVVMTGSLYSSWRAATVSPMEAMR